MRLDLEPLRNTTKGPWRWEANPKDKRINLTTHGNTVMGFARQGMSGAAPEFFDPINRLLFRAFDRPDWFEPFPGRVHHSHWLMNLTHPDARLIAEAPTLLREVHRLYAALDDIQLLVSEWDERDEYDSVVTKDAMQQILDAVR